MEQLLGRVDNQKFVSTPLYGEREIEGDGARL
jgi:hypothetical protein